MTRTSIEWTATVHPDGTVTPGSTWNPVRGCSRVSEGCRNCYAERVAARFSNGQGWAIPPSAERSMIGAGVRAPGKFAGFASMTTAGPRWTGRVELVPEKLDEPLRWRKPRRVFVNSMSDLFHEALPFSDVAKVFERMAYGFALVCRKRLCNCECEHDPENYTPDADAYSPRCRCWREVPEHTYQILTKRPARMREFFEWLDRPNEKFPNSTNGQAHAPTLSFTRAEADWPLPNVWLGVSVEDQATADVRIPLLLQAPAAVRFVSYEPALGPVDFGQWLGDPMLSSSPDQRIPEGLGPDLHWIIVGGESGPGARPFDVAWARSTVEQCKAAGVAVFVKQLGARPVQFQGAPSNVAPPGERHLDKKHSDPRWWPEDLRVREFPGDAR